MSQRIGVEIEYAGLDCATTAQIVQDLFPGDKVAEHPNLIQIKNTSLGSFRIEVDSQWLLPDEEEKANPFISDKETRERIQKLKTWIQEQLGKNLDSVPVEIVCPPIALEQLDLLEVLVQQLRECGAKGTSAHPIYGFGLHLNIELEDQSLDTILAYLRAYLLLEVELRALIKIDPMRILLPFIKEYTREYKNLLYDPAYKPDWKQFITDFMEHNPSRNRGLDLQPLLCSVQPEMMKEYELSKLVKPRPAFHYRLPNCLIDDPAWTLEEEWLVWLRVKELANSSELLKRCEGAIHQL